MININDIALLLSDDVYTHNNAQYDLNGDNIIDIADISVVLSSVNYAKFSIAMN